MSTNTLQHAARVEAVPAEPQEKGRRTPSPPLRLRRTSPCEGSRRQCRRAHPPPTRCTMLLSEKSREAGPSQHLGTPMVRFCPTSFVEKLTERETEDIQRHFMYENSNCRGHDLHNPRRDCSIAPDSYRTEARSSTARTLSHCHCGQRHIWESLIPAWENSERGARCVLAHEGNGSFVVQSKASPVRRPYDTFSLQACGKWE